jgi:uncharacterized protein (DUF2336 family)
MPANPQRNETTFHDYSIFAELEATLAHESGSQRFTILRRVTDLFLAGAESYSDDHIAVFDGVIGRLIENIEHRALIELSGRLAPVDNAPVNVIGRLSRNDDIKVSGPILERSKVLMDSDLVEIAKTKSQAHLSAIAGRAQLAEPVTDVLIDRGSADVARRVTANKGARFSKFGFTKAVSRAQQDESLALTVADRMDLPPELFDTLVRKATETVRERLMANAKPEMRERIQQVLSEISNQVARSIAPSSASIAHKRTVPRDPTRLKTRMAECIAAGDVPQLINAVAVYCDVPARAVEDLVRHGSEDGLLLLGKASDIGWPQLQDILSVTMPAKTTTNEEITALFTRFLKISMPNAQRAAQFIRTSAVKSLDDLRNLI